MAFLILPSRRTRQPQGFVQLRSELAASARAFVVGGIQVNFVGKYPVATGSSVYGPTSSIGRTFSGTSGENSIYLSTNIPVSSEFTSIALIQATLVGTNPGLWRSLSFQSEMCIFQGANFLPWMRIRDNDYLKPSSGAALSVGQVAVVAFRYSAAKAETSVWWDGIKQHTGSGGAAPYADSIRDIGFQSTNTQKLGHIAGFIHCDVALSDGHLREITESPERFWGAVSVPDPRRLYFGVSGGAGVYELDAQPGGYTVSGTAATLARGIVLDAQPASYTLTGTAATLVRGYNLDAQPGSYTVTGTAATLARGLVVNAAPGSFAVTGTAATLEYTVPGVYTLDAQPGSYSLTGVAATLTYTPLNAYTLDAQPGSYTITGIAAELTYAGASIWTDVGLSAATWSDVGGATSIWTDL